MNDLESKVKYVRIMYLPPATVAEVHFYGETLLPGEDQFLTGNEEPDFSQDGKTIPGHFAAGINAVDKLIHITNLAAIKPDFRLYGFADCSKMEEFGPFYGFGRWLTIPDEMELPFPFVKKQFKGGLYCAYSRPLPISGGESDEWDVLNYFVQNNDKYVYDGERGEPVCNYSLLEEYLNYINLSKHPFDGKPSIQADLFIPIREK